MSFEASAHLRPDRNDTGSDTGSDSSGPVFPCASEDQLDDLRRRLLTTRTVPGVTGERWQHGTDPDYLTDLVQHWATGFDWRAAERRIQALPWQRTSNGTALVHQHSQRPDAPAVVLLHGWPDSFLRYERVLPLLHEVHVVVPCLPGYPGSGSAGANQPAMADQLAAAVAELGYTRCVVSGGDIGAQVAEAWARRHPEGVAALHLTDVPHRHITALDQASLSGPERDFADRMQQWRQQEGSYAAQHATKPNTLAAALGDSPAGLASWLVEKLRAWSDTTSATSATSTGGFEAVFSRDDVLTWVSLYWFTGSIGTSFTPYALMPALQSSRVEAPTVVTAFPQDPLSGPRQFAERLFDVRAWTQARAGGHFTAWEQPEVFVEGLRAAVAPGSAAPRCSPGGGRPTPRLGRARRGTGAS